MRRQPFPWLLAGLVLMAPATPATDFRIDRTRSHADFGVRLLWLHTIDGRFTEITGDVDLDSEGMATVDVRIEMNSVAMESARFRRWVLAPEFFDAAAHPTARFLSDPVPLARLASGGILDGKLDLRGVVQPVHLELLPADCADIIAACTIRAEGFVLRSDFGMTSHGATLSDRVRLDLRIILEPTLR